MEIGVELPAPGAVFVAAGAMNGQVAGLFIGQMAVFALHPLIGFAQAGVAPRQPASSLARILDPVAEPLVETAPRFGPGSLG